MSRVMGQPVPQTWSVSVLSYPASRDALLSAFSRSILGLYTDNASAPLNAHAGLRQLYKFGLYSHCAYVNGTAGSCTDTSATYQFRPYTAITSDMLSNYSTYTDAIIRDTTFASSSSLGRSSHTAYCLLLLGSILSIISIITSVRSRPLIFGLGSLTFVPLSGMINSTWALFVSASTAIVACTSVLVSSAIWTVIIRRAKDVNSWTVQPAQFPLGIKVATGVGLHCTWVASGLLAISIIFHTL